MRVLRLAVAFLSIASVSAQAPAPPSKLVASVLQDFNQNVEFKGPNPYFSLALYGGYSSPYNQNPALSTTGSINAGSSTLTIANAQDFANGQGVVVYLAGKTPASEGLLTPSAPAVTPINLGGGSTAYSYSAIAESRDGALTATGPPGSTTTGAATLGVNTITLTNCTVSNGVATYTSSSPHNIAVNTQIDIEGFSQFFDLCNGAQTVLSVPSSTTFTTSHGNDFDHNLSGGTPTAKVVACNTITFAAGSYSGLQTLRYWIYRNGSLAGVAQGLDPWFQDCGQSPPNVVSTSYIPLTPPSSSQNGYLATTIANGGGTATLTLVDPAVSTANAQSVLHDNSVPLLNTLKAASNTNGGMVYIPNDGYNWWIFNATTDMTSVTGTVHIHINSSSVYLNQPWILRRNTDIEGEPRTGQTFQYVNNSVVQGGSYPLIYITPSSSPVHIHLVQFICNQSNQTCVYSDEGPDGGGNNGIVLEDVSVGGTPGGRPMVWKGGFDYYWKRGSGQNNESSFNGSYILYLTNSSPAVVGNNQQGQLPGRVYVQDVDFAGGSIQMDCTPNPFNPAGNDYTFGPSLFESIVTPFFHFSCPTGSFSNFNFPDIQQADDISGVGTPLIDGATGGLTTVTVTGGQSFSFSGPTFIGPSSASLLSINAGYGNPGNVTSTYIKGIGLSGNFFGRSALPLGTTPAPNLVASAGGNVPLGSHVYQVQWLDVDGNPGPISPQSNIVISSGNQKVTISPGTPPVGAVYWFPYRDGARASIVFCTTPFFASRTTFIDTDGFTCGQSFSQIPSGAQSEMSSSGLTSFILRLVNQGIPITWSSGLGAPTGNCGNSGSIYSRLDGGSSNTLYVCENGTWTPK